jgi:hypothetical protein
MRTGYIYFAVILLQFFVFFNNISLIFHPSNINIFFISMGAYALSVIILIIGIIKGAKAGGGNCFMFLLFLINIFFYVWYSFAGFLNSFMTGIK